MIDKIIDATDFIHRDLPMQMKEWELWVITIEKRDNHYYFVPKNISKSMDIDLEEYGILHSPLTKDDKEILISGKCEKIKEDEEFNYYQTNTITAERKPEEVKIGYEWEADIEPVKITSDPDVWHASFWPNDDEIEQESQRNEPVEVEETVISITWSAIHPASTWPNKEKSLLDIMNE